MASYEAMLRKTIRKGHRRQDAIDPHKYRYRLEVPNLPDGNTHIVAVVLFRDVLSDDDVASANNYVVTAYTKDSW